MLEADDSERACIPAKLQLESPRGNRLANPPLSTQTSSNKSEWKKALAAGIPIE